MYISSIASILKNNWLGTSKKYVEPDTNERAVTLDGIYLNHPYRFVTIDADPLTKKYGHWSEGIEELESWCKENCTGRWRRDIRRMYEHAGILEANEIGGGDYLIFAFENDQDLTLFTLHYP